MKKVILSITSLMLITTCVFAQAGNQVQKFITWQGNPIPFYEFKPSGYDQNPDKKFPLIIFLHGLGEVGNGTPGGLPVVLNEGIPRLIHQTGATMTFTVNGQTESFIVLSPQTRDWWQNFYIDAMLDYAKQNLRVDVNRIYLTGLSLGGGGTWSYTTSSLENAKKFAAVAPISGLKNYDANSLCPTLGAAKIGVWAFHNLHDPNPQTNVSNTQFAIGVLQNCPGNTNNVQATYPDVNSHNAWDNAYDMTHNLRNPNLFEWFLTRTKQFPTADAGADIKITPSAGSAASEVVVSGTAVAPDGRTVSAIQWSKISGPGTPTTFQHSGIRSLEFT